MHQKHPHCNLISHSMWVMSHVSSHMVCQSAPVHTRPNENKYVYSNLQLMKRYTVQLGFACVSTPVMWPVRICEMTRSLCDAGSGFGRVTAHMGWRLQCACINPGCWSVWLGMCAGNDKHVYTHLHTYIKLCTCIRTYKHTRARVRVFVWCKQW